MRVLYGSSFSIFDLKIIFLIILNSGSGLEFPLPGNNQIDAFYDDSL